MVPLTTWAAPVVITVTGVFALLADPSTGDNYCPITVSGAANTTTMDPGDALLPLPATSVSAEGNGNNFFYLGQHDAHNSWKLHTYVYAILPI